MQLKKLGLKRIFVFVLVALSVNAFAAGENKADNKPAGKVYEGKGNTTSNHCSSLSRSCPVYEGKGEAVGYNEERVPVVLTVKATKNGDKLTIVDITAKHEETEALGGKVIPRLIKKVKEKQDYEKVDIVAGVTETSKAFKSALDKAVKDIKNQK